MTEENERTLLQKEKDKLSEFYKKDLEQYQKFLENTKSIEEKLKIIKEVYTFAKVKASKFYNEKYDEFFGFNMFVRFIHACERSLENESLIDITPNFYYEEKYKTIPIESEEELLNYLWFEKIYLMN